ncbi:hypothetical protein BJX76DRAFT_353555 [Aspergillus varians]
MKNELRDLVLLIARRSNCAGTADQTGKKLDQSLTHTRRISNKAFASGGDIVKHIRTVLDNGRETNRPVMLVVNGWDGLSTNSVALVNLSCPYIDEVQITMRIWLQELQVFREVSVRHVLMLLSGKYDGEFDGLELPRLMLSVDSLETSERLYDHKYKHHRLVQRVPCRQQCGKDFSRNDHRDRHERETCLNRPTWVVQEGVPPSKRAKRGSKSKSAKREQEALSSDNSYPSYDQIQQNTWNFPRVNADADEKDRLVYKLELFCRFPGCCHTFSEPTNLRTHYANKHHWKYPKRQPGNGNPIERKFDQDSLDYLARCAHFGWNSDEVGEPPMMFKRSADGIVVKEEGPSDLVEVDMMGDCVIKKEEVDGDGGIWTEDTVHR